MSQQSHFIENEIILPAEVPAVLRDRLKVTVPISLAERRIYLYVEVAQSAAAEFLLWGTVIAKRGGSPVAE